MIPRLDGIVKRFPTFTKFTKKRDSRRGRPATPRASCGAGFPARRRAPRLIEAWKAWESWRKRETWESYEPDVRATSN
jgi:hypothetical protein